MDSKEYYMLIDKIQEMLIDLQSDYSVSSLHSNLNNIEAELSKLRSLKSPKSNPQTDPDIPNITIQTPQGKVTFINPIVHSMDLSNQDSYYLPNNLFKTYDTHHSPNAQVDIKHLPFDATIRLSCTQFIKHNS